MVVTQRATTHGEYARKYPPYCYRTALKSALDIKTIHFPQRENWMEEFPQYSASASEPTLKIVELLDYRIELKMQKNDFRSRIVLTLLPGKYTLAKTPRVIYQAKVLFRLEDHEKYFAEAERSVFGSPS